MTLCPSRIRLGNQIVMSAPITQTRVNTYGPGWLNATLCPCPEDTNVFTVGNPTSDPWYDGVNGWTSTEFLGVIPVSWLEDTPVVSNGGTDTTPGVGTPGKTRFELEFMLVATTRRGLAYGVNWVTRNWVTECCNRTPFEVTRWCDPTWVAGSPNPDGRWVYPGVTITEFEWLPADGWPEESGCARRFMVVFETGARCAVTQTPVGVATVAGPWDTPVECWECPDCPPVPVCDDFGCGGLVPDYPTVVSGSPPGFIQPLEIVRKAVLIPAGSTQWPPELVVTLTSGLTATTNVTVKVVPDLGVDPALNWGVYECVTPLQLGQVCQVPAFGSVDFDGTTRVSTLQNSVFAATQLSCAHTGWQWTATRCEDPWPVDRWLVVETNPQSTSSGFVVTVEAFDTQCGPV